MSSLKIPSHENIESGIALSAGRGFKFVLKRNHDETGFSSYHLENQATKEYLNIPRFLFEMFRATLKKVVATPQALDEDIEFKGKVKFKFESTPQEIQIRAFDGQEGASGAMRLSRGAGESLSNLLHDNKVEHGSDVLSRILAYHRLFKFTFVEGSESLNSSLALRTDVLSQIENFNPRAGSRVASLANPLDKPAEVVPSKRQMRDSLDKIAPKAPVFKSRLGEKNEQNAWAVDYASLFGDQAQKSPEKHIKANTVDQRKDTPSRHVWPLPLLSSEVKNMAGRALRCDLSADEIQNMREEFLVSQDSEYFLGFEMIDVIFKSPSGKLKTFRFPLFYTPIAIAESGRQLIINGRDGSRVYLNHLALANLIESFTPESNLEYAVDKFFKTILAQKIEFESRLGRIYLSRELPVSEEIFLRTREIILGHPGENGLGGILNGLNIIGAECDTESVNVYKSSKIVGPIQRALELDLESMLELSNNNPDKFLKTLPGRFLSASHRRDAKKDQNLFCNRAMTPVYRPQSTRRLMDKLNAHDIVLLEGPPGTGKTYTIMNLLIHAVATGQRVLIVSDQEAGLHALNEKIVEYLKQAQSPHGMDSVTLWQSAAKLLDKTHGGHQDLSTWIRTIETCLGISDHNEIKNEGYQKPIDQSEVERVDNEIAKIKRVIGQIMDARVGPKTDIRHRVSPKRGHATTVADIDSFVKFLRFMGSQDDKSKEAKFARQLIRDFVLGREYLSTLGSQSLYDLFQVPDTATSDYLRAIERSIFLINMILKIKPKTQDDLGKIIGAPGENNFNKYLYGLWTELFPQETSTLKRYVRAVRNTIDYPAKSRMRSLAKILRSHLQLLSLQTQSAQASKKQNNRSVSKIDQGVWRQIQIIHDSLGPNFGGSMPLTLEVCRFATTSSFSFGHAVHRMPSVQELLEQLHQLDQKRSDIVRQLFIQNLTRIAMRSQTSKEGQSTPLTSINAMLQSVKEQPSLDVASGSWRELQERLLRTFPIWMCRKQAVSFLFPCKPKVFDLVIVDEATQCRVDDALPLMLRAKKFVVVGDDKQTVLAKDSVIDDYLFAEFNLDEHLRSTQARGIKGGGSHIFGLVKGIKEASVMLDEHYRCPPEIIDYSNKYVYHSELKVMQWRRSGQKPAMYIDWSEKTQPDSDKPESGPYKGIEIDMIDRYFEWVAARILEIERDTGKRVNMETDVALVYFLLKNEPYVRAKKAEFLAKLDRGSNVLDGAGAALQGKERPYIFYLWDITRGNMMAFKQGDDPDKRRGELNVLMSRPKERAYHFLHKNFDQLDHEKASIAQFLWKAWKRQQEGEQRERYIERKIHPGPEFFPWRRSSGNLMAAVLEHVLSKSSETISKSKMQTGVVVGDPRFKVDLIVSNPSAKHQSIGIVDLCGFDWHAKCADDIVDYYFQLCRATPKMRPVFLFMHELADPRSRGFAQLKHLIK